MGIVLLFFMIPLIIILISNSIIVYEINSSTRKMKHIHNDNIPTISGISRDDKKTNNAVITLLYICAAFVLSYVPYISVLVLKSLNVSIPMWVDLLQPYFTSINSTVNPVIFLFNNTAFRNFLKRKFYDITDV